MKSKQSYDWRIARLLVKHAGNVLPSDRADWAQATCNEVDHLPDSGSALRWAAGCVYTSYIERVTTMDIGDLRISRTTLVIEMLMCFGLLSWAMAGIVFQLGNSMALNGSLLSVLSFSSLLTGPIGLIFAFRSIILNQAYLNKVMLAVLIIPGTWTFMVNGIFMWILAEHPNVSWAWGGTIMGAILPALGIAHLVYMSKSAEKMSMTA